jgi:hypothetical protein
VFVCILASPPLIFSLDVLPWRQPTELSARNMYNELCEFLLLYVIPMFQSFPPLKGADLWKDEEITNNPEFLLVAGFMKQVVWVNENILVPLEC